MAGFAQAAATIAAVTIAAEALKSQLTPPPRQFAQGTVLGGASHANGGVQLYSRSGYHFGEAEADEVILTKGVWQNPLLRPLASQLNVLGGGAALVPRTHMAVGGGNARSGAGAASQHDGAGHRLQAASQCLAKSQFICKRARYEGRS